MLVCVLNTLPSTRTRCSKGHIAAAIEYGTVAKFCLTLKRGRSEHLAMEDVEGSGDNFSGLIEFRLYSIPEEKNVDESFLRMSYLTF